MAAGSRLAGYLDRDGSAVVTTRHLGAVRVPGGAGGAFRGPLPKEPPPAPPPPEPGPRKG